MKLTKLMIRTALVMAAVFLVLNVLGGRQYAGMLSGTLEGGLPGLVFGVFYTLSWFATVLLVPILLLAGLAGVAVNGVRLLRRR
ncbi:hypothetical protein [Myxococcus sp. RHSTA-1-4]|uniref:hypothetical protein n=1 Tax=Myxococcus sp. RHSTA-1-4 TaxID=2874601 RepID=UPI001CC00F92|nr:hypothetical protein [Myxococcus sp. RHSTA-1-4]MBZ4417782.1 hypothetical protein [Myxococcus sp. RHSTA-1-4]